MVEIIDIDTLSKEELKNLQTFMSGWYIPEVNTWFVGSKTIKPIKCKATPKGSKQGKYYLTIRAGNRLYGVTVSIKILTPKLSVFNCNNFKYAETGTDPDDVWDIVMMNSKQSFINAIEQHIKKLDLICDMDYRAIRA